MSQIEAGACGKPVIGIRAMGMLDTLTHCETALLATVAEEIVLTETIVGDESGYAEKRKIIFDPPRIAECRASVDDLSDYLKSLMTDANLRAKIGTAAREHIAQKFDYRTIAKQFVQIIHDKLGIE